METNDIKTKKLDNSSYHERFQFIVTVNDNIICQRYFKIHNFNHASLNSKELFEVLDGYKGRNQEIQEYFGDRYGVVQLIQRDLESKSRLYMWGLHDNKVKLTGFGENPQNEVTYAEYGEKEWDESEFVKPWEVTFKFSFLVDDKPIYERIWDGSTYPKMIRSSVDLTNGKSNYPLLQYINSGRPDLVFEIIKRICYITSNPSENDVRVYTPITK
jgi:hypothetical protein